MSRRGRQPGSSATGPRPARRDPAARPVLKVLRAGPFASAGVDGAGTVAGKLTGPVAASVGVG